MGDVTQFGRFCKKLRIDNNELLADMASKLGVSSAFLSKVENGKKKPPKKWEDNIKQLYELNEYQEKELKESIFNAINSDSIDLSSYKADEKELMLSFARKINTIDKDKVVKILREL